MMEMKLDVRWGHVWAALVLGGTIFASDACHADALTDYVLGNKATAQREAKQPATKEEVPWAVRRERIRAALIGADIRPASDFSASTASAAAALSALAYESQIRVQEALNGTGYELTWYYDDRRKNQNNQFIVVAKAELTNPRQYAIAIRGTEADDVKRDFNAAFVFKGERIGVKGELHEGFAWLADAVWQDKKVSTILNEVRRGDAQLLIAGHSLGGAAAAIFTARIIEAGIDTKRFQTYTFGAPAAGDTSFAKAYSGRSSSFRLVVDGDSIPGSTVGSLGYRHYGTEMKLARPASFTGSSHNIISSYMASLGTANKDAKVVVLVDGIKALESGELLPRYYGGRYRESGCKTRSPCIQSAQGDKGRERYPDMNFDMPLEVSIHSIETMGEEAIVIFEVSGASPWAHWDYLKLVRTGGRWQKVLYSYGEKQVSGSFGTLSSTFTPLRIGGKAMGVCVESSYTQMGSTTNSLNIYKEGAKQLVEVLSLELANMAQAYRFANDMTNGLPDLFLERSPDHDGPTKRIAKYRFDGQVYREVTAPTVPTGYGSGKKPLTQSR